MKERERECKEAESNKGNRELTTEIVRQGRGDERRRGRERERGTERKATTKRETERQKRHIK